MQGWLEVTIKLRYPADSTTYHDDNDNEATSLEQMAAIDQESFEADTYEMFELIGSLEPDFIEVKVSEDQDA